MRRQSALERDHADLRGWRLPRSLFLPPVAFTAADSDADGFSFSESHAVEIAVANAVEKSVADGDSFAHADIDDFSFAESDAAVLTDGDRFVGLYPLAIAPIVGSAFANGLFWNGVTFSCVGFYRRDISPFDFIIAHWECFLCS
jgi:hypothetical protein